MRYSNSGQREGGTARLEEAVAAYREALEERTRERAPLDWAATQTSLGDVLSTLGNREGRTTSLEEALVAYREALKVQTREQEPLEWARIQNNLGSVLRRLGERESGTTKLEEAATAYYEALKEQTRERGPADWAIAQNNLGGVLQALGSREGGTASLKRPSPPIAKHSRNGPASGLRWTGRSLLAVKVSYWQFSQNGATISPWPRSLRAKSTRRSKHCATAATRRWPGTMSSKFRGRAPSSHDCVAVEENDVPAMKAALEAAAAQRAMGALAERVR